MKCSMVVYMTRTVRMKFKSHNDSVGLADGFSFGVTLVDEVFELQLSLRSSVWLGTLMKLSPMLVVLLIRLI